MKLYHVSAKDWGERVVFAPRVPSTGGPRECKVRARICVATTLRGCLLAINGTTDLIGYTWPYWRRAGRKPLVVYRFRGASYVPTAAEVPDVALTGERWLLQESTGERIGYIDMNALVNTCKVRIEPEVAAATYRRST